MGDPYASSSADADSGEHPKPPPTTQFVVMVGLCMIGAFLLAAVILGRLEAKERTTPAAESSAPAPAPAPSATTSTDRPAASPETFTEVKEITAQIAGLASQLKGIETKVEGLARAGASSDVQAIKDKVDNLDKSIAAVLPVSEKVSKLGERVDAVDAAIKSFKDEVSGLTSEVKKLAAAEAPKSDPVPVAGAPTISEGIDLFKAGKYKEAGELFKKVETVTPNDARVYYYEAFTNALVTKDWKGETLKVAAKAAALEKAGATRAADIDAAFADLPANLKPWLAFFRRQGK